MAVEFVQLAGEFNPRAVCSGCKRHAGQTRISTYCIAAVTHEPLLCDECMRAN